MTLILVPPLFFLCPRSSKGMTAAFLYWGGYRDTISCALFKFSGLNSKGIYIEDSCQYIHGVKFNGNSLLTLELLYSVSRCYCTMIHCSVSLQLETYHKEGIRMSR